MAGYGMAYQVEQEVQGVTCSRLVYTLTVGIYLPSVVEVVWYPGNGNDGRLDVGRRCLLAESVERTCLVLS